MMGYSYSSDDGPKMCFNAAKSWQTGWYTSKSTIVEPTASDGTECFEQDLYGIVDYANAAAQTVLVRINDANSVNYYVTFNRKFGINSGTKEAGNQVTVTRKSNGDDYANSKLLSKLSAGGQYSFTAGGQTMFVKVGSIPNNNYAQVIISKDGESCSTSTSAPTKNPTSQPTNIPTPILTVQPTEEPTTQPTDAPTDQPTKSPTDAPSPAVSFAPSILHFDDFFIILPIFFLQMHLSQYYHHSRPTSLLLHPLQSQPINQSHPLLRRPTSLLLYLLLSLLANQPHFPPLYLPLYLQLYLLLCLLASQPTNRQLLFRLRLVPKRKSRSMS